MDIPVFNRSQILPRADIIEVIREKVAIVAEGAGKRGDRVRESFYRSLAEFDPAGSEVSVDTFRAEAWSMIS